MEDYLKLINENGAIINMKLAAVNKKFDKNQKVSGADFHGNTLCPDNVVKVTEGAYKGRKGVIKHIYKNTLFLWDKEFSQSNGIFVMPSRNVQILGQEFMKGTNSRAVGGMNKRNKDEIIGKTICIIGGEFKGHRGRVTHADDK